METIVQTIAIEKLIPHPDNPNKQSKANFAKLVRNIERTGKYEPLIVRPHPQKDGFFQLINGHHRCRALEKLGCKNANVIIWDIDDEQTDILLATLNRLGGSDMLDKKLILLKRLNETFKAKELGRLLPQTARQIERLVNLKLPDRPAQAADNFLNPLVFFVSDNQQRIIEDALSNAEDVNDRPKAVSSTSSPQARRAAALTKISQSFNCRVGSDPTILKSVGQKAPPYTKAI